MPSYDDLADEGLPPAPDLTVYDDGPAPRIFEEPIFRPVTPPSPDTSVTNDSDSSPEPTAAQARPRRAPTRALADGSGQYAPGTALLVFLASCLQPGGGAFGTQFLGLNNEANGSYIIYLCSGEQRPEERHLERAF